MVIVIGTFRVEPAQREAFIANRTPVTKHSRAEAGCVTYAFTADAVDPGVVILTERWTDRPALDAHLVGLAAAPQPGATPSALSREIVVYQADDGVLL
jgi:quinol monooxygenase YgiN